jgi:pimeloyl-ACP methyl ester carboxylesterase
MSIAKALSAIALLVVSAAASPCLAQSQAHTPAAHGPRYGDNPAAGHVFRHDGVDLYYEVYGSGPPLLLVHGNGGSIWSMKRQIEFFRTKYTVIAMDSRDQGMSGDSPDRLTFEAMTDDLSALIDHVKLGPVKVLGWSDGGIEALLLGIRHPEQVLMIASMAANIDPEGVVPELGFDKLAPKGAPAPPTKPTRQGRLQDLDLYEPHIAPAALEAIKVPTLVLASDHDVIRDEHTLLIYHHLALSQLVIFPDATHMIPVDDPARFNAVVDRSFATPFVKKDRIKDLMVTGARLKAELEHGG